MSPEKILVHNPQDQTQDFSKVNVEIHRDRMILVWPKGTSVSDELSIWIEDGKVYLRQSYIGMSVKAEQVDEGTVCVHSVNR